MEIVETYDLIGSTPNETKVLLEDAVKSVSDEIFFDGNGKRLIVEVRELDARIASAIESQNLLVKRNFPPFETTNFNVDVAVPDHNLLIEIEKGRLPRLELDVFKMAAACIHNPDEWRYGALIVPASYIKLNLEGKQAPYDYLKRLGKLIQPMFNGDSSSTVGTAAISGLIVIGYVDPRDSSITDLSLPVQPTSTPAANPASPLAGYKFQEGVFGKGRLVLEVIKQFVRENPGVTYSELESAFPVPLQGSFGCFSSVAEAKKISERVTPHRDRHFRRDEDLIELKDRKIAVCNHWGLIHQKDNIVTFIDHARGLGYQINPV